MVSGSNGVNILMVVGLTNHVDSDTTAGKNGLIVDDSMDSEKYTLGFLTIIYI